MALDPKTKKQINDAIKTLTSLGTEFTGKARELTTLLYALQQGFLDVDKNLSTLINDISSGKFEKANFSGYLKSLGLANDEMNRMFKIYKAISSVSEDQLKNTNDYSNILDEINKKEQSRKDTSDQISSISYDIVDILQQQFDLYSQNNDNLETQSEKVKRLLSQNKRFNETLGLQVANYQNIREEIKTVQDLVDNIEGKEFTFNVDGEMKTFNREDAVKYYQEVAKMQRDTIQQELDLRRENLLQLVAEARGMKLDINTGEMFNADGVQLFGAALEAATNKSEQMVDHIENVVDHYIKTGEISSDMVDQLSEGSRTLIEYLAEQKKTLSTSDEIFKRAQLNLSLLSRYAPALKSAVSASDELASKFQTIIDIIPAPLQKLLGLDNFKESIHEGAVKAVGVFKNKLLETGSAAQAVRASLASYGSALTGAIGLVGGFVLALVGAFAITKSIEDAYVGLSEKLDISVVQAKKLHHMNLQLASSQQNQYLTLEEITDVQAEYIRSTGDLYDLMDEGGQRMVLRLGEISQAFGYSVETATKLNSVFKNVGATTEEALNFQTMLGAMSEAMKIAPEIVAKDLIESSETVSTYFAGMPEQAAMAAIEIRRMGMSLKQAGKLAESMLDMESFMTDMFELAAMGGPDLSRAFDLGVTGDLQGMTDAVMTSIGSLQQFNDMDFLTRKKLSSTIGMSTDELAKSLVLREKMGKISTEDYEMLKNSYATAGDIQNLTKEQLEARLSEVHTTKDLAHTWEQIKLEFTKAILPLAEDFAQGLIEMRPLLDGLVGVARGFAYVLRGIYELLKFNISPLKTTVSWFTKAESSVANVSEEVKGLNEQVTVTEFGMGNIGVALGGLLGGGFVIKKVTKMVKGLAKGAVSAYDTIRNIGGGGSASQTVTETMSRRSSNIPDTDSTGSMGTKLVDRVKNVGKLLKSGLQEIGGMIQTGLQKLADLVRGGVNLLKDVMTGLVEIVSVAIKEIGSATGQLIKNILGGIGEGLNKFSPNAIVGAAALTVLSGAFWVASKALEGFANVGWGNVGKGLITLGALTVAARALSKAVPEMLLGAVGIAAIGAALIPAAYAFQMFGDVKWGAIGKAVVGIGGLALVAAALGAIMMSGYGAVAILAGAAAIAILGASLKPFAYSMTLLQKVNLETIGSGLGSLADGLLELTSGGLASGLASLFGGNPFKKLGYLAEISQPLSIAAESIKILSTSLMDLSKSLEIIDLDKLNKLYDIKSKVQTVSVDYQIESSKPKVGITQTLPPSPETTAQNVLIREGMKVTDSNAVTKTSQEQMIVNELKQGSSKKVEMLLTQLINEMRQLNNRPIQIVFDDGTMKTVNNRLKSLNNNR